VASITRLLYKRLPSKDTSISNCIHNQYMDACRPLRRVQRDVPKHRSIGLACGSWCMSQRHHTFAAFLSHCMTPPHCSGRCKKQRTGTLAQLVRFNVTQPRVMLQQRQLPPNRNRGRSLEAQPPASDVMPAIAATPLAAAVKAHARPLLKGACAKRGVQPACPNSSGANGVAVTSSSCNELIAPCCIRCTTSTAHPLASGSTPSPPTHID
jgi:hypothetical protein